MLAFHKSASGDNPAPRTLSLSQAFLYKCFSLFSIVTHSERERVLSFIEASIYVLKDRNNFTLFQSHCNCGKISHLERLKLRKIQ